MDWIFAVVLLVPIMLLLLSLLAICAVELFAILTGRKPYTFFGRRLIANYPVIAIGVIVITAVAIGWLTGHLYAGCV